ncbi:hypothetical protein RND81_11G027800 [Saponaria officinalis]|uniref:Galectin domain-containing protein n=1 Tax=Saponaria officinalis TaxID=3572 RepID=A0AAW1HGA1_SAPOF
MTTQFPSFVRFLEKRRPVSRHLHETPKRLAETPKRIVSKLVFLERENDNTSIYRDAMHAWAQGGELWAQVMKPNPRNAPRNGPRNETFRCPDAVSVKNGEFRGVMRLPCGMRIGSHVTVVGQPRRAHIENGPGLSMSKVRTVSQFMVEVRRENGVGGGEEGTRLLHFNPRVSGDWSGKPVIEMNNCFRGQWGSPVRCEGSRSPPVGDTVDGQVKCEKWKRDDVHGPSKESKETVWLGSMMGRRKIVERELAYPFSEAQLFVLTIYTGFEGFHASVNGRHISSFAYRNGFDLEDGLTLNVYGDVDVHSVFVGSLPTSHPRTAPRRYLEMSTEWKARPVPNKPVVMFIGVISAADHFAERMAVRKSWMQHDLIKSSQVVARFFVALHKGETINLELKKEAEFFGDIVIVPYLDHYDLVVLKTLAICEYGVNMLSTKYIMKCDDDTFVRVDAVIKEASQVSDDKSVYVGKINYYHKPLRKGKWAVTHQEWSSDVYPPYADGPGYIISSDIARFIVSEFQKTRLKLFKMEDVSVGIWVEQFNKSTPVEYTHNKRFHQSGCFDGYITAHYQSPKQLVCLWRKLQAEGKPKCCNLR